MKNGIVLENGKLKLYLKGTELAHAIEAVTIIVSPGGPLGNPTLQLVVDPKETPEYSGTNQLQRMIPKGRQFLLGEFGIIIRGGEEDIEEDRYPPGEL